MGLREWAAKAEYNGRLGMYSLIDGTLHHAPDRWSIVGATATVEDGRDIPGRTTATRVAVGAIVAGPIGAIVGGMFKKDRTKVYVVIDLADGGQVVIDAPVKDTDKARAFASKVNASAARFAPA